MASENKKTPGPAAPPAGPPPTMQEYRKEQMRLREMIEKQKQLSGKTRSFPPLPSNTSVLAAPRPPHSTPQRSSSEQAHLEETINQKETAYLDSTPAGNIITRDEGYIKGGAAAANKKKAVPAEQNRVFTRSSISYRQTPPVYVRPSPPPLSKHPHPHILHHI